MENVYSDPKNWILFILHKKKWFWRAVLIQSRPDLWLATEGERGCDATASTKHTHTHTAVCCNTSTHTRTHAHTPGGTGDGQSTLLPIYHPASLWHLGSDSPPFILDFSLKVKPLADPGAGLRPPRRSVAVLRSDSSAAGFCSTSALTLLC